MHLLIGENEYLITERRNVNGDSLFFKVSDDPIPIPIRITTKTASQMLPIPPRGLLRIHEPSIVVIHYCTSELLLITLTDIQK